MKFVLKPFKTDIIISAIANVHFFEFSKQFYTEKDKHPFAELVYVESGELKVSSENYEGVLKKGEMIIHRPNEEHFLKNAKKNDTKVIIIGFECVAKELKIFSLKPFRLNAENVERLARIVKEGRNVFAPPYNVPTYNMKETENKLYGSMQLLKILIEEFLITIIRETRFEKTPENEAPHLAVAEITKYLNDNFKEKITLDELAFLFGTNRATLCKEFKSNTGKTVGEFICDKKLSEAARLIKETNLTFTEIAEKSGFSDIHYFTNSFKEHTGITPTDYRKKLFDS